MNAVDVLIVGAGPVGLTLAVECARREVSFRIVDAAAEPSQTSKALAIWEAAQRVFAAQGVVTRMHEEGLRPAAIRLATRRGTLLRVPREAFGPGEWQGPLILPQCSTERILLERLGELGHSVERPLEFVGMAGDSDGVTATLTTPDGTKEEVRCRYVVGCDGAHSAVRHAGGFRFEGRALPDCFILCDATVSGPLPPDPEVMVFLSRHGVLPMFPIRENVWRIISTRNRHAGTAPPTLEELQEHVNQRAPKGLILSHPEWLSTFRISERRVDRFRMGRVLLAGDAAHIHSPAGGQGMNTGIQDAFNLGWKLEFILRHSADAEMLLTSYHDERAPEASRVIADASWRTKLAMFNSGPLAALRNLGAAALGKSPAGIAHMAHSLSGSRTHYARSPIHGSDSAWHEDWRMHGSRPGQRMLDVRVMAEDVEVSLLDQVLSTTRFSLIFYSGRRPNYRDASVADELRTRVANYSEVISCFSIWRGEHAPDESWMLDSEGDAHRAAGAAFASAVLVRPDGFVAARSQPADLTPLLAALAGFLPV
jgi:2-polyprenyl-6-methoxyphenol hydroxylase-like FAD-dependent oxidoreductase